MSRLHLRLDWDLPPDASPLPPEVMVRARMPRWVRLWYLLPLVDRYAYAWMWHHGGWWLQEAAVTPGAEVG